MTSDPYCDWCDAAQAGTHTPLGEARLRDAWEWSRRHGTDCDFRGGAPSVGAVFVRELLRERLHLLNAIRLHQSGETEVRNHIASGDSEHTIRCILGMLETGECTVADILAAGGVALWHRVASVAAEVLK